MGASIDADAALARLAEIRGLLSDLPSDAFDERSALDQERFEIQDRLGPIDLDAGRSTEDLVAELVSQRARLHQLEGLRMNVAAQQGGGGYGSGGGADGWGAMQLSLSMDEANGIQGVQNRIGHLKMLLAERGVEDPAVAVPVARERRNGRWVSLAMVMTAVVAGVLYVLRPIPFPTASSDLSWAGSPLGDASNAVAVVSQRSELYAIGTMAAESGARAVVWSSSDGSTWTSVVLPHGDRATVNAITAYGRGLMAVGAGSDGIPIVWTFDETRWTIAEYHEPPSITDRSLLEMTAAAPLGSGVVVVGSEYVGSSSSAAVWYVPDTPVGATSDTTVLTQATRSDAIFGGAGDQRMLGVAASADGVLAVGTDTAQEGDVDGAVWFSSRGTLWKRVSSDAFTGTGDQVINAVTWFSSGAVAVGSDGSHAAVWYSVDGLNWTRVADTTGALDGGVMTAITAYGKGVVAVGAEGSTPTAWYSPDGETWIKASVSESSAATLMGVARVGRKLVAVGGSDTWIGK